MEELIDPSQETGDTYEGKTLEAEDRQQWETCV